MGAMFVCLPLDALNKTPVALVHNALLVMYFKLEEPHASQEHAQMVTLIDKMFASYQLDVKLKRIHRFAQNA